MSSTLISTSNGSPDCGDHLPSFTEPSSIHSALINEIYDVPMREISRPLLSVLNEDKVQSLIQTIRVNIDEIPPIDILWYEAPNSGNNYFFAMGGCHRWEAHQRLNLLTIRAKLIRTTLNDLRVYFGSSLPNLQ